MAYKNYTSQWRQVANKVDFDICGENKDYWVNSHELPAVMFRKIAMHYLFIICKYPSPIVAAFFSKHPSTVLHDTANYLQDREYTTTKMYFDRFETPEVLENVHTAFVNFLFKYKIENKNFAFEEATARTLGLFISKLGKVNFDKYRHVITDLTQAKKKLEFILNNDLEG